MATKYIFQKDHYFAIHNCWFTTYNTDDGKTLGDVVCKWSPVGGLHEQYDSIAEAMNRYLISPFPNNPKQWFYDTNRGLVIAEVLSSVICENYGKGSFAKSPTKSEMSRFERGREYLYIVQFSMALQEVYIQDVTEESAKAEKITPLSL